MSAIESRDINLSFDMHGCPNACRHCWLGTSSRHRVSEDDVRRIVSAFREYRREGEQEPFFTNITTDTWVWEPDYPDHYREVNDFGNEMSTGGATGRYELLSVWRLGRDETYAPWAKEVGPDTCQITFFGMEDTTDWFVRRRGTFRDSITATERLLDAGMKPRWQFFLTRKILPELGDLMRLADSLQLRERVEALGGEFDLFLHTPSPDGNAFNLEELRPTIDEVEGTVPEELLESSRRHFKREQLWGTEAGFCRDVLSGEETGTAYGRREKVYFAFIGSPRGNGCAIDVYSNAGDMHPWWKLGVIRRGLPDDEIGSAVNDAIHTFENDLTQGFQANFHLPPTELVSRWGDMNSRKIYSSSGDLLKRCLIEHCGENVPQPVL